MFASNVCYTQNYVKIEITCCSFIVDDDGNICDYSTASSMVRVKMEMGNESNDNSSDGEILADDMVGHLEDPARLGRY